MTVDGINTKRLRLILYGHVHRMTGEEKNINLGTIGTEENGKKEEKPEISTTGEIREKGLPTDVWMNNGI